MIRKSTMHTLRDQLFGLMAHETPPNDSPPNDGRRHVVPGTKITRVPAAALRRISAIA